MKQFLLVLVLVQVVLHSRANDLVCSKHEVEHPCVSPCLPTCQRPNPPVCNFLVCNKGCVCKPGLIRNEKTHECIPQHLCPKECGQHEEYTRCGAACIQTCQNLSNPPFCPSNQACTEGCICRRNFIFDEVTKKCILRRKCLEALNDVAAS